MSGHLCCGIRQGGLESKRARVRAEDRSPKRSGRFFEHLREFAGWLLPGATLVLLPKCPLCLAGYIALGTGIGLSVSGATYLRLLLIGLCVITLFYIAIRQVSRFTTKFRQDF
ncbi:MAG TPA: hypothetical protein VJW20_19935 [Candidatus Angelobacter sp.]|nr:hypothetical protein [Candidatus Angelobacter sp.]